MTWHSMVVSSCTRYRYILLYMCSFDIKVKLFKTYSTPLYAAQLWWNYTTVYINKLYKAYHNVFNMFLCVYKFESTSTLCVLFNVPCCASVILNILYRFITRRNKETNICIDTILKSNIYYKYRIITH